MVSFEQFEVLRLRLVAYEDQQELGQTTMKSEVKEQVSEVTDGLKELYNTASVAVGAVALRVDKLEEKIRGGGGAMQGQRSLLHYKNMNVGVLEKIDQWRTWKSEVEDYTEETMPGIHKYLEQATNEDEEVSEVDWDEEPWNQCEMIWRFLKRYTTGEAKKVVTSVSHHNGWKLHLQFEPALVMREAVVMASFTNIVSRRAKTKTPQEAKALLLELDERAKRIEEVTGEAIENRRRMSAAMGVLDSESMRHTVAFQGAKQRADMLQRKVIEFASQSGER